MIMARHLESRFNCLDIGRVKKQGEIRNLFHGLDHPLHQLRATSPCRPKIKIQIIGACLGFLNGHVLNGFLFTGLHRVPQDLGHNIDSFTYDYHRF